jgi:hypothetical protein
MTDYESVVARLKRMRARHGGAFMFSLGAQEADALLARLEHTESKSIGQDLAGWRGQIEDECVRLKSSGDESALEALLWVLEHVLPCPADTEYQSVPHAVRADLRDRLAAVSKMCERIMECSPEDSEAMGLADEAIVALRDAIDVACLSGRPLTGHAEINGLPISAMEHQSKDRFADRLAHESEKMAAAFLEEHTECKSEGPAGWLMFDRRGEPAGEWFDAAGGFTESSVCRALRELDVAEPLDAPHSLRPVYFIRGTRPKSTAQEIREHAGWVEILGGGEYRYKRDHGCPGPGWRRVVWEDTARCTECRSITPAQARIALAWREACLCGRYDDEPEDERAFAEALQSLDCGSVDGEEARR